MTDQPGGFAATPPDPLAPPKGLCRAGNTLIRAYQIRLVQIPEPNPVYPE